MCEMTENQTNNKEVMGKNVQTFLSNFQQNVAKSRNVRAANYTCLTVYDKSELVLR